MDIKNNQTIKKYPYLGYSPNLIEYFLIIGFDKVFKAEKALEMSNRIKEIYSSVEKIDNPDNEIQDFKDKLKIHNIPNKPVVLNSISSDFSDGMINEEEIINYMFPTHYTPLYSVKNEKIEPPNQNLMFYLSTDKIFETKEEDDAAHNSRENMKNIMFNVYGYLFWEMINIENIKVFFPKIFVFISQYSYFKYFSFLSQNILFRIKKNLFFEIPLEIQLYNIINFTPSPINCDLQLELLANIDLVSIKQSSKELTIFTKTKETGEKDKMVLNVPNNVNRNMTLLQLSGYPYFDIDLSYLFNYFNFESFFTTYLFSFLEFKMIFFSPSLDFLNTIMYIIRFLSYPFIDNKDYGQIYSISKEDFLNGTEIRENNLIGVNCEYDEKMVIPKFYKDYFIISFDLSSITIYFNGKNIAFYTKEEKTDITKLITYIENSLSEEREKITFLEKKLFTMHSSLYQCFRVIMNNNNNFNINNQALKNFFIELSLTESNYRNYEYQYNEFDEYNATIQKAFYTFNLSIYGFFHDTVKLSILENTNEKGDGYKSTYYDLKVDPYNEKNLCEEEKIFFNYFTKTTKYNQFVNLFLKKNICCDLNRPSMIFAEEFMNINKALTKDETKDYIHILNNFYQNSNKVVSINFTNFYSYYYKNLTKIIYNMALDTKIIKLIYETKNNISKIIYRQKEILLDDNIIKRYVYLLNNMEQKDLLNIFPTLKFKLNDNIIPEINTTFFADFIESHLLEEKFYTCDEIVGFIVLIIYIIALKNNKLIFHFFEEIITKMKINRKIVLRKYIYIILILLNNIVKEKLSQGKNIIKELLVYKEIMNSIYNSNNAGNKYYYPNERLADIINNFNIYQKEYEKLIQKNKSFENENKKLVEKYETRDEKDILEDGVDYKVLLQNNACRDKGTIKDEVLIRISEALEYKGNIQTTCKSCQLKIRPNLFFVHVPLDKSSSAGFYSICYSYKISLEILRTELGNITNEKNKTDDEYFNIVGNMIYYISFKEGLNNKISNYLATCLK